MDLDMDFTMDSVNTLHRKDTTKGPPLRVLSLGMFVYTLQPPPRSEDLIQIPTRMNECIYRC